MTVMNLDWTFLARNLARHLALIGDADAMARTLEDAEQDARDLGAPHDFWLRVAHEYRSEEERLGSGRRRILDELRGRQPHLRIFASESGR